MKKYFMGIKWINAFCPILHLRDFIYNSDEYAIFPEYIDIEKLKSKICIGAVNPLTREYFNCNNLVEENKSQCYYCMHLYDFYNCARCHGGECMSKDNDLINYCNTPHYVYLAYFSKDKIKVGTASEARKYDRLLEQGAMFSIFIAKTPTGKIARQIEKCITDNGVTGAVTTTFKMKNLVLFENVEEIRKELLNLYSIIIKCIDADKTKYLIDPEFNHFDIIRKNIEDNMMSRNSQIDMFTGQVYTIRYYEVPKECDRIVGKFLFAIGKIIALENKGMVQLYDSKKLEGFLFDFKNVNLLKYSDKEDKRL